MLFAVEFRYYGATNSGPSKWRVKWGDKKKFVPFNYAQNRGIDFEAVAKSFLEGLQPHPVKVVGMTQIGNDTIVLLDYAKGSNNE